jgi:hypothetical protein
MVSSESSLGVKQNAGYMTEAPALKDEEKSSPSFLV